MMALKNKMDLAFKYCVRVQQADRAVHRSVPGAAVDSARAAADLEFGHMEVVGMAVGSEPPR